MKPAATVKEVRLFWENPVVNSHLLRGKRVEGYLSLRYCDSLTSLPEGLEVGGWFDLEGCRSLTSLPEGLRVGGSLNLHQCASLASLPERLSVGGWFSLISCNKLIAWLLRHRKVDWLLERVGSPVWGLTSDPLW